MLRMLKGFALGIFLVGCSESNPEAEKAGTNACEQWVSIVDLGDYERSWDTAAELFKSKISSSEWASTVSGVRKPLGEVVERSLRKAAFSTSLPGAPDGQYVVCLFETSFANKQSAVETITVANEGGSWHAAGYFIR